MAVADVLTHPLALGVVAGLVGTALATLVLFAVSGGFAPVVVAVAAVRRAPREAVSTNEAVLAFHALGAVCGVGYLLVWPWFDAVRPLGLYPSFADAAVFAALLYAVFAVAALPRTEVDRRRWRFVRTQWLVATGLFGLSLSHGFALLEALFL